MALRLVCEREAQIEVFSRQEYWSVAAQLKSEQGLQFEARLVQAGHNLTLLHPLSAGEMCKKD